ncbi:YoaK family protein [Paludibaculum fermentans]|uniref:YoaK family protein n=1 Tax=Paludibaculum fermentans TaxID=1473598 RepID=UPI003EB6CD47
MGQSAAAPGIQPDQPTGNQLGSTGGVWSNAAHNSLSVALLLAASGGFLDAFTYFGHGHVFANAMTGNVVLLGINAAAGETRQALSHLWPILAFLLGVAVARGLRLPRFSRFVRDPSLPALSLEILFLCAAGWLPRSFPSQPLVLAISFLAALQSSTFPRVEKWAYNSTMTTGNLRQFGEAAFSAVFSRPDAESARKAILLAAVCLAFTVGAVVGAGVTSALHNRALVVCALLLSCAWLPLVLSDRRQRALAGGGS